MSIFAFCAFLPREFERNRTLSKKTIYRLRKFLEWCIIKLKIRLRIFLYTPVLCLWSSDDRNHDEEFDEGKTPHPPGGGEAFRTGCPVPFFTSGTMRPAALAGLCHQQLDPSKTGSTLHLRSPFLLLVFRNVSKHMTCSFAAGDFAGSAQISLPGTPSVPPFAHAFCELQYKPFRHFSISSADLRGIFGKDACNHAGTMLFFGKRRYDPGVLP